jgi:hypothetical protein
MGRSRNAATSLLAGFAHPPNVDAARWLVETIMPRVWATHLAGTLALVGANRPRTCCPGGQRVESPVFAATTLRGATGVRRGGTALWCRVKSKVGKQQGLPWSPPRWARRLPGVVAACSVADDVDGIAGGIALLDDDAVLAALLARWQRSGRAFLRRCHAPRPAVALAIDARTGTPHDRPRAPAAPGLAGGGTDVAPYCDLHGGFAMNAAIDRHAHATIDASPDGMLLLESLDRVSQPACRGIASRIRTVTARRCLHQSRFLGNARRCAFAVGLTRRPAPGWAHPPPWWSRWSLRWRVLQPRARRIRSRAPAYDRRVDLGSLVAARPVRGGVRRL